MMKFENTTSAESEGKLQARLLYFDYGQSEPRKSREQARDCRTRSQDSAVKHSNVGKNDSAADDLPLGGLVPRNHGSQAVVDGAHLGDANPNA